MPPGAREVEAARLWPRETRSFSQGPRAGVPLMGLPCSARVPMIMFSSRAHDVPVRGVSV